MEAASLLALQNQYSRYCFANWFVFELAKARGGFVREGVVTIAMFVLVVLLNRLTTGALSLFFTPVIKVRLCECSHRV